MKGIVASLAGTILFCGNTAVWACPQCRPQVDAGIYNEDFAANLFVVFLPVAVLITIGFCIHCADALKVKLRKEPAHVR